jgi:putative ABC transport system permease protein
MLFGVAANDPLTFALVPTTLLAVGLLACWAPAMRATAITPTEALREE